MTSLLQRTSSHNRRVQFFRSRLVRCGWVVVLRHDGLRRSIPIFRRQVVPSFFDMTAYVEASRFSAGKSCRSSDRMPADECRN